MLWQIPKPNASSKCSQPPHAPATLDTNFCDGALAVVRRRSESERPGIAQKDRSRARRQDRAPDSAGDSLSTHASRSLGWRVRVSYGCHSRGRLAREERKAPTRDEEDERAAVADPSRLSVPVTPRLMNPRPSLFVIGLRPTRLGADREGGARRSGLGVGHEIPRHRQDKSW